MHSTDLTLGGSDIRNRNKAFRNRNELNPRGDVAEAKKLVRHCAEPSPVGDSIKRAINRAAYRLGFARSRTRKLWYGNAQRVDAYEMDELRALAATIEISGAVDHLEGLREHLSTRGTADSQEVIAGIDVVLRALGHRSDVED